MPERTATVSGAGGPAALGEALAAIEEALQAGGEATDLAPYVERVADAAGGAGLPGLQDICSLLGKSLARSPATPETTPHELRDGLMRWAAQVAIYVRQPDDPHAAAELVRCLRAPYLAAVGLDDDAAVMEQMLLPSSGDSIPELALQGLPVDLEGLQDMGDPSQAAPQVQDLLASMTQMLSLPAQPARNAGPRPQEQGHPLREVADAGTGGPGTTTLRLLPATSRPSNAQSIAPNTTATASSARHSPVARELMEILISELPEVDTCLATLVGLSTSPGVEPEVVREAFERAGELLDRYASAVASVGLDGLARACSRVRDCLQAIRMQRIVLTAAESELLRPWKVYLAAYLRAPHEVGPVDAMLDWLDAAAWGVPPGPGERSELRRLLLNPDFSALEQDTPQRPTAAGADDVSLVVPPDINPDLLDGMLQELPGQAEALCAAVQRLTQAGALEDIHVAQRIAHTIKGAANTVGIRGVANLTHHLEDILLALARHAKPPTRGLADALMSAADCLQGMGEALCGAGPAPTDAQPVLQQVLDWANRIDRTGLPEHDAEPNARLEATAMVPREGSAPAPRGAEEHLAGPPALRVAPELIDELLRLAGETIIHTGQVQQRVRRCVGEARAMQSQLELLQQLGTELEQLIDVKDLSTHAKHLAGSAGFDALELDQYNELHTCSRRLVEAALDVRQMGRAVDEQFAELDEMLVLQVGLNRSTQETVLRTRMVAVKTLFARLERSLRQSCRLTGKQAALHPAGGDTLMDGEVLGAIVDPLMHLLRNAVDHGIEPPHERQAAGKDPVGQIRLEFLREGNNIVVRCRDDGTGLDLAAIRRKARELGLVTDREPSVQELQRLILAPNFSTRERATQLSGRGIGLDAVNSAVAHLGGSLSIESAPGAGCCFQLTLPVTLISSHALLARIGDEVLALAARGIEQIVHRDDGHLQRVGAHWTFQVGDQICPAFSLAGVLDRGHGSDPQHAGRSVLLTRADGRLSAVLVEAVLESRDLVVKQMGRYMPRVRGVIGATILGDGAVTPVLDLPELLRAARHERGDLTRTATALPAAKVAPPEALVVDDSLSARRALSQLLGDAGYEVRTARDGLEALGLIEARPPDILLVDLEMPRMNGIELSAHLRARAATAALPIVMVTSRSTEKHRREAQRAGVDIYLTKPFGEDELLQHVRTLLDRRDEQRREPLARLAS